MKRAAILLLCLLCWPALTQGEGQAQKGKIWGADAPVYQAASADSPQLAVAAEGESVVLQSERQDGFVFVLLADGDAGWVPEACVAQPAQEEWNGYPTGAVLCQTLSLRAGRSTDAKKLGTLQNGETFVALEERDGWTLACRRSEDGEWWEKGWIQAKYTVKEPRYIRTGEQGVEACAYPAPEAPCVAEIPGGTELLVIGEMDGYVAVNVRAASAFIRQEDL